MTLATTQHGAEALCAMLAYRRPAGSKTERNFIATYIDPLGCHRDAFGNRWLRIGDAPVLWSSHTDTVHKHGGRQNIVIEKGVITTRDENSGCLGADCTAGVWLMREMILAQRPGLYVFHRAEEVGGQGSSFIVDEMPGLFAGVQMAIAFDRRGFGDVITHQAYGRTASDAFAWSLAKQLGVGFKPSDAGVFTDTANYADAIAECTNVSVGYLDEHTKRESQCVTHLLALRAALLALDVSRLVVAREPGDWDRAVSWEDGLHSFSNAREIWGDADQEPRRSRNALPSVLEMVRDYPHEIADILEAFGMDAASVAEEIYARRGVL